MRSWHGNLSPFGSFHRAGASGLALYAVLGYRPTFVADMVDDAFYSDTSRSTFGAVFTTSRLGNATMVDSDGLLKWAPHNLALNSATPATQSITVVSGADYTVECTGSGSITLSGAGTGTVTEGNPVEITASTTSLTLTVAGSVDLMWCYRSDLGGMAPVPADARVAGSTTYVPTTSTAKYLPRRHNHKYNGSAWVDAGTKVEKTRTQLLHTTSALVTQNVTTTAQAYTLHFTGTGTVTLSGAYSGSLVGTGTGEENRVSLTFTPTAATLTLTVTGTVTDAQLEAGDTPTSYIPNLAGSGTVTRAADTNGLTIDSSIVPWPTPKVIGDELVTNGTFDTDSDWNKQLGWTISGGTANVYSSVAGSTYLWNGASVVGKVYQITYTVTSITSGAIRAVAGTRLGGITATTTGTYTDIVVANGTNGFGVYAVGSTTVASVDNISVKEINPLAVCIQMEGDMTYADTGVVEELIPFRWLSGTPRIFARLRTDSTRTGAMQFIQNSGDGEKFAIEAGNGSYPPGVNVPFNIASRHGSTFINGAVDGTALTADLTPVALPDLSSTDLQIGYDFMGNIKQVRIWTVDIGDTGLEAATS